MTKIVNKGNRFLSITVDPKTVEEDDQFIYAPKPGNKEAMSFDKKDWELVTVRKTKADSSTAEE